MSKVQAYVYEKSTGLKGLGFVIKHGGSERHSIVWNKGDSSHETHEKFKTTELEDRAITFAPIELDGSPVVAPPESEDVVDPNAVLITVPDGMDRDDVNRLLQDIASGERMIMGAPQEVTIAEDVHDFTEETILHPAPINESIVETVEGTIEEVDESALDSIEQEAAEAEPAAVVSGDVVSGDVVSGDVVSNVVSRESFPAPLPAPPEETNEPVNTPTQPEPQPATVKSEVVSQVAETTASDEQPGSEPVVQPAVNEPAAVEPAAVAEDVPVETQQSDEAVADNAEAEVTEPAADPLLPKFEFDSALPVSQNLFNFVKDHPDSGNRQAIDLFFSLGYDVSAGQVAEARKEVAAVAERNASE